MKTIFKGIRIIINTIKKLFIAGILTILPLAVTIVSVRFVYGTAYHFFAPWGVSGITFTLLGILFIGLLGKIIVTETIIHPVEKLIHNIPIIGALYSGVKTFVDFFNVNSHPEFERKVVFVPYPNEKTLSLAILIGSAEKDFQMILPDKAIPEGEKMMKVFIPTTHITIGYFFIVPESSMIPTELGFEEAIKSIVSCGIILPASIKKMKKQALKSNAEKKQAEK